MRRTPRRYVAATNPAISPTTPPPTATKVASRSAPRLISARAIFSTVARRFADSLSSNKIVALRVGRVFPVSFLPQWFHARGDDRKKISLGRLRLQISCGTRETVPREQTTAYLPRALSMRIVAILEPQNVAQLNAR